MDFHEVNELLPGQMKQLPGQISQMRKSPKKIVGAGFIAILAVFVVVMLYASFGKDIVGFAFGAVGEPCPEKEGKLFLSGDRSAVTGVGKCVGGVKKECTGRSCPTATETASSETTDTGTVDTTPVVETCTQDQVRGWNGDGPYSNAAACAENVPCDHAERCEGGSWVQAS